MSDTLAPQQRAEFEKWLNLDHGERPAYLACWQAAQTAERVRLLAPSPCGWDVQRLYDLVRHQRSELHVEELITDEEYAELASDHGVVARLEGYDALRREASELERLCDLLADAIGHSMNCTFKVACICGSAQRQPFALGEWARYKQNRRAVQEKGVTLKENK